MVELGEKGHLAVRAVPLTPLREVRELRGTYMDLTDRRNYAGTATEDYLYITLTDEEDVPDAASKLRIIYPNLMKLDYDNARTRRNLEITGAEEVEQKSPLDLFAELYEKQNNQPMSHVQSSFLRELMVRIWEEDA